VALELVQTPQPLQLVQALRAAAHFLAAAAKALLVMLPVVLELPEAVVAAARIH
jgi:hypothetical protein